MKLPETASDPRRVRFLLSEKTHGISASWCYNDRSMKAPTRHKKYLISLEETRSAVALFASIVVFLCTLSAVLYMVAHNPSTEESSLHYFTVLSNLLSAIGAALMFPFALEGIRKKRFVLPRWLILFRFSGATCVAITMISSVVLILPTKGIKSMQGANFWLHLVTPVFTIILFQCVETGAYITRKEMLKCLIPYVQYVLLYTVMAVIIGEENGGWSDFYMAKAFWPAWVSFILMTAIGLGVAQIMRIIHNRRVKQSLQRITKLWSDDLEPEELLIEAYGLGRYIGAHCPTEELTVPLDIFDMMEERYHVPVEKLTKAYVKGAINAVKDRQKR